jgi:hypothetical protein
MFGDAAGEQKRVEGTNALPTHFATILLELCYRQNIGSPIK